MKKLIPLLVLTLAMPFMPDLAWATVVAKFVTKPIKFMIKPAPVTTAPTKKPAPAIVPQKATSQPKKQEAKTVISAKPTSRYFISAITGDRLTVGDLVFLDYFWQIPQGALTGADVIMVTNMPADKLKEMNLEGVSATQFCELQPEMLLGKMDLCAQGGMTPTLSNKGNIDLSSFSGVRAYTTAGCMGVGSSGLAGLSKVPAGNQGNVSAPAMQNQARSAGFSLTMNGSSQCASDTQIDVNGSPQTQSAIAGAQAKFDAAKGQFQNGFCKDLVSSLNSVGSRDQAGGKSGDQSTIAEGDASSDSGGAKSGADAGSDDGGYGAKIKAWWNSDYFGDPKVGGTGGKGAGDKGGKLSSRNCQMNPDSPGCQPDAQPETACAADDVSGSGTCRSAAHSGSLDSYLSNSSRFGQSPEQIKNYKVNPGGNWDGSEAGSASRSLYACDSSTANSEHNSVKDPGTGQTVWTPKFNPQDAQRMIQMQKAMKRGQTGNPTGGSQRR